MGELWGVGWAGDIFFVIDGQKRNYLSCTSQRARGATKNGVSGCEVCFWFIFVVTVAN